MSLAKHQPPAPQKSSKASAFVAGFVLSAILQPFEVLRTHIVLQGDRSLGTLAQLKKSFSAVYRAGGVAGLWRGAGM